MAQVYLSQYARRAGVADTASHALNAVPAPKDTWIQYNKQGKFGAEAYFRYIYPIHSFQHGYNTTASGNWSHTEGANTYTGFFNTYSSSILSGSVTLSAEYGNITSSFRTGDYIYLNDYYSDNTLGTTVAKINSTSWDNTSSYVILDVNNIHATTSFVGSLGTYYIKNLLGNRIAGAFAAHAEGKDTYAFGIGSHAEGSGSYAIGKYSHTEGNNTIAVGDYQTIVGQYNIFSTSQSAFIIGDGYARIIESGNIASNPLTGSSKFNIYSQFTPLNLFTSSIITLVSASSSVSETFPITKVIDKGSSEYEITIDGVLTQNYYDNIDTFSVLNITRHNLLFASQSYFQVSASNTFLQGLPTGSQPYILTYEPETGQVFYTASILGGLTTQDEGNLVTSNTAIFNFTGSGVSASLSGSTVNVYIPGGGGSVEIRDEGNLVTTNTTIINFTGSGVSASLSGSAVNVYIPSSSGAILLQNLTTNITVGGSDSGTLYPAGILLEDILRDILTDYFDPTITFVALKNGGTTVFDVNTPSTLYREVSSSLTFTIANFNATSDNPGGRFAYSSSFTASGATVGNFNHFFGNDVLATSNNLSVGTSKTINRSTPGPVTFTINGVHPSSSALPIITDDATLTYVYPIYYGMSTFDYSKTSSNLDANSDLTKGVVAQESTQDILLNGLKKYIYFAYPDDWGTLESIRDLSTNFEYLGSSPAFTNYTLNNQSGSVTTPWDNQVYRVYQYYANYPNGTNVNSKTYRFTFA